MIIRFLATLLCLGCFLDSHAQSIGTNSSTYSYKFTHYTSKDGLPQNSILAIAQDEKGFLWMGTDDGLARFDGYQFRNFRHDPSDSTSISSNVIRAIISDSHQYLWVGTEGGGVSVFDPASENFYPYEGDKVNFQNLNSQKISSLVFDQEGKLWVGTQNEGLMQLSLPEERGISLSEYLSRVQLKIFDSSNSRLTDKIWSVYIGKDGTRYAGTAAGGAYFYNSEKSEWSSLKIGEESKPVISVKTFLEDDLGKLWVGTENRGLWVRNSKTEEFKQVKFPTDPNTLRQSSINITSIKAVAQNQLWVGTLGGGLYILSLNGNVITNLADDPADPYSLNGNSVYTIYEDGRKNIWLGMYSGEGLNKVSPSQQQFEHYRYDPRQKIGLSGKMVKSILKDRSGNLWVGLFNGGLNLLPSDASSFQYFNSSTTVPLNSNNVQALLQSSDNKIWIGTDGGGINVYDPLRREMKSYMNEPTIPQSLSKDEVWALAEDTAGMIWIGTANGGGLNKLDPVSGKVIRFKQNGTNNGLSPNFSDIRSLLFDPKGNLWIGTYGAGLNKMDSKTGQFQYFVNDPEDPQSLSNNIITSLIESKDGTIWVGTFGGGLNRLDQQSGKFKSWRVRDGLPSDLVKSILQDNSGQLWISTVNGLSAFDPSNETFRNFTEDDGLQSNEFNLGSAFKDYQGKLYFGGTNGFSSFFPERITPETIPKQPVITDLKILNTEILPGSQLNDHEILPQSISYTETLYLEYDENNLELQFSTLEYSGQNHIRYSYQLEGYDLDWVTADQNRRFATYTNLSPGNYTFKVKAIYENNLSSSSSSELAIIVSPPWYLTIWAYLAYALIIVIATYQIKKFISWRLKLRNDLQFERIDKEKQAELNQLKIRFFTNISHELRTPLMLIHTPLEKLNLRRDLPDPVMKQLDSIHSNSKRLLGLINQLLDFRKQETGHLELQVEEVEIKPYLQQIITSFDALASEKNIQLEYNVSPDTPQKVWLDPAQFQKVIYNLIYNAFKFTGEKGEIKLILSPASFVPPGEKESKLGILISVTDNGIGIEKKHLEHLFERFYQIKRKGQIYEEGTGIGLSISKNLVDYHHGKLEVDSENTDLTVFQVFLQLGNDHFDPKFISEETEYSFKPDQFQVGINSFEAIQRPKWTPEVKSDPELINRKLLIVEDNPELLALIAGDLGETFSVITASNGQEALNILTMEKPDLIVSDVMMPVVDGIELCRKVKQDMATSHIQFLLLTARGSHGNKLQGYESGADDYLVKPFELDLLKLKIRNLLSSRAQYHAQFAQTLSLEPSKVHFASSDQKFLKTAMETVESNIDNTEFSVNDFVKELGYSRTLIFEKFRALSGLTPNDFIQTVRLKRASQLITDTDMKISEIGYSVGFSNPKYFSKCFLKQFGKSPSEFKRELNRQL
jgi:signal transduction histidine kinase/ligand-binding sensor domain-containing protein/DNA-binding response OmpR family regulator